jgi:hypothetical protein
LQARWSERKWCDQEVIESDVLQLHDNQLRVIQMKQATAMTQEFKIAQGIRCDHDRDRAGSRGMRG